MRAAGMRVECEFWLHGWQRTCGMLTVEVPVSVLIRLRVARLICRGSGSVPFNGRIARQQHCESSAGGWCLQRHGESAEFAALLRHWHSGSSLR